MRKIHRVCLFLMIIFISGCTDQERAIQVLFDAGYKNIRTTGFVLFFFGCTPGNTSRTGFVAIAPGSGRMVEGVVCSGWLTGATIHIVN